MKPAWTREYWWAGRRDTGYQHCPPCCRDHPHLILLCDHGDPVCGIPYRESPGHHVHAEPHQAPPLFISGVFIPIESLPSLVQGAAYFSPLTYGNDLIQAAWHGNTHFNPLLDIAMLCIFILIFQIFASQLYWRWND